MISSSSELRVTDQVLSIVLKSLMWNMPAVHKSPEIKAIGLIIKFGTVF